MQYPVRRGAVLVPTVLPKAHGATAAPFRSFWMGGYEGADHRNGSGVDLDMARANAHLERIEKDYADAARLGIRTVRESIGWRVSEPQAGRFDWHRLHAIRVAAQRHGIQVLWTLMHYGTPDDVSLLDDALIERFARFAGAAARELVGHGERSAFVTPINEIGFLAWAACESRLLHPYCTTASADESSRESGYLVKRRLVRAALRAIEEIRALDPEVRFLHVEPLIHVAPPATDDPQQQAALHALARTIDSYQWQAWDMLCGREAPELGGSPEAVDWLGANHYHSSQWEIVSEKRLSWSDRDPRRAQFSTLLAAAWKRYGRPLIVAETGHFGAGRAQWLDDVAAQVARALDRGVPVHGLSLYPLVNRSDWDDENHWHDSGLWDVVREQRPFGDRPGGSRLLNLECAERLRSWQALLPRKQSSESNMPHLIVFSHLRWDFVRQRPQHLMSRLARRYPVLFVEEPVRSDGESRLEATSGGPGVQVLRPRTPVAAAGFHDDQLPILRSLLAAYLSEHGIDDYLVWCYTPMALPLLGSMRPRALVYDCMDELSAFAAAPRQLGQREAALLKAADLVFTGGPSLHEARCTQRSDVHCLPSAVEALHFAPPPEAFDSEEARDAAELQRDIAHPRLGFFGVVDERLDRELVARLADSHPEWQIVMVGPTAKIDPASLPQRPNLHWLGMQSYARLPFLLADWDLCLLPFAANAATRFISPTKTLEYMAAGKPIVSTAVKDVATLYGDVVAIADDTEGFVRACERLLDEAATTRREREQRMASHVSQCSWDRSVEQIDDLLQHHLAKGTTPVALRELAGLGDQTAALDAEPLATTPRAPARRAQRDVRHLVIGAGPTGLSAAYHLGLAGETDVLLVERGKRVGGWCRSIEDGGFVFDYAGHIMFSNDPYVLELYALLLGENLHWQNREAWIWSKGVHTRYPFQGSLHGLPPQVLEECLVGAIEARFGAIDGDAPAQVAPPPANFLEFIHRVWGAGIAKLFAVPYNEKLWAVPLDEIETSWLGGRVPLPDLAQMIRGALVPTPAPMGPNARFGYPLRGGFQALMDAFVPRLRCELSLETNVLHVSPRSRTVRLDDGRSVGFESLVSTMPLPQLVAACGDEAPEVVRAAAAGLRHVSVRCVNLGIGREKLSDKHWIYYPEDTVFHRIFLQGNASPHNSPPGGFGLICEISYSEHKPLPCDGAALVERVVEDCRRVGIVGADDPVLVANQIDMPYAYVVYDHARAANVATIRKWFAQFGVILAGRYSEWEYYNSDHAFIAGRRAGEQALAADARRLRTASA